MGDKKGRQDVGKADAPSNAGTHIRKQWETRVDKTSGKRPRGDKTSGRGTHHPKHAVTHVGRQGETRVDG